MPSATHRHTVWCSCPGDEEHPDGTTFTFDVVEKLATRDKPDSPPSVQDYQATKQPRCPTCGAKDSFTTVSIEGA